MKNGYPLFIAELKVITSNNAQFPPGAITTWCQSVRKGTTQEGMAVAEIANFLDIAYDEETKAEHGKAAASSEQPLAGTILDVVAVEPCRRAHPGKSFTKCEWTLVELSPLMKRANAPA